VTAWRLTEAQRRAWVEGLLAAGTSVAAPVDVGGLRIFRRVASSDEVVLDEGKTRWSPKDLLFPSTEALFSYRLEGGEVSLNGAGPAARDQVLLAVRPCDAAGLARLDDVFLGEQADSPYAERRARTTVVSLACSGAGPECFCTAVGGSPAGTDGSDLQLVPLEDGWLLRALTEKGESLVAGADWTPASAEDLAAADARRAEVEAAIARSPLAAGSGHALEEGFANPVWELVGERCLGCGVCAYVCPSCSCFDVVDEGGAYCGERCRLWDSCGFAGFTKHASGHNPRATQPARYRQRVLHKFAYFPIEHEGRFMCVGCGRCTVQCPVGIDIGRAVEQVVASTGEGAA
jgi:ferredoxin